MKWFLQPPLQEHVKIPWPTPLQWKRIERTFYSKNGILLNMQINTGRP
jgi:hypothetical protein